MPLEQLERVATQARVGESVPSATLAHVHWQAPNKHDSAVVPLQDVIRVAGSHGGFAKRAAALQARLDFMHEWGIIPDSQRCGARASCGGGTGCDEPYSWFMLGAGHTRTRSA